MMGELARRVGIEVRAHRKALGLNQEDYGKLLGYHRTWIGHVERGERNLTLESVEKLAGQLGVEPLHLLKDDEADTGS